jgi:hypothetical protein
MTQWQKATKRRNSQRQLNPVIMEQSTTEQGLTIPTLFPPLPPVPTVKPTPVPAVKPKKELTRYALTKKLPEVLSSWIEGIDSKSIYQIESPKKVTGIGFNEIAWRDQDGSKLYLENLASFGVIDEKLKVTYQDVQSLKEKSGWTNSLPDTIFVKLKLAGGLRSRMANKKMVLGLLDSYQSDKKLPNKPVLKETKTDDLSSGEFVNTFSVKGITQKEPMMRLADFMNEYSKSISDKATLTLTTVMSDYEGKLRAGFVNCFRVEDVDVWKKKRGAKQATGMLEPITTAANTLEGTLRSMINHKEEFQLTEDGVAALDILLGQVTSAIADGFRNEFDTRRWQQWFKDKPDTEKPLTEDQLVPGTGTQIGTGLQGPVFKYELDPALGRRPVALKYDSNGLNEDAVGAGIPLVNAQQSVRAVAAFKISQKLNLSVIPRTEFFVGTDDNGRPKLGQAMDAVNGPPGQRKNATGEPVPVDIDYGNRVVQKGLSDLQVFDNIIGHSDRNAGNWIYEKDTNGRIIGVKGIDNDDTFGQYWEPGSSAEARPLGGFISKTPGIPPIVDISMALSILNANFNTDIQPLLAGLSDEEIAKAAERFDEVQTQVESRVMDGKIASIAPTGDAGVQANLEALRKLTGANLTQTLRWGNLGIMDTHTETNSYLGFQIAQKEKFGVVPEN